MEYATTLLPRGAARLVKVNKVCYDRPTPTPGGSIPETKSWPAVAAVLHQLMGDTRSVQRLMIDRPRSAALRAGQVEAI